MKKLWWLPAIVAGFLSWYYWHQYESWLAYATGSYNCTPKTCPNGVIHNYNFNSGFGSIIIPPLITLLGVAVGYWWHNQCHVSGCFWPARRKTAAGDLACWIHHPHKKLTHLQLLSQHDSHSAQLRLLDEIHRHVSKETPNAGNFAPSSNPPEEDTNVGTG